MKLEFEMTKKEAQEILGRAIKEALAGAVASGLEVFSVDWDKYGERVTVVMDKPLEPEAQA